MNRTELESLCRPLFGYGWKSRLAEALGINRKSVSRWIANDEVPDWAAERVRELAGRPALPPIPAPPPGTTDADDRDDACQDAIEPDLTRLVNLAEDAGWHRAEIATAIVALVLADLRSLAGDAATLAFLDDARGAVVDT